MPRGPGGELALSILNRQRRRRVVVARVRRILEGAARELGVGAGEVSLVLAGDRFVRELNGRFRGKDAPTDVLSFPARRGRARRSGARRNAALRCEGDIAISVETAERNARTLGRTLAQEIEVLALHGFLHLLGHDHETDDGSMLCLERALRRRLRIGRVRRVRIGSATRP